MARSDAATVDEYLAELPPERRVVISAVRDLILKNLPQGYVERMTHGMISYDIPLARYPTTYNGQPLNYLALAAQKRHYALYLMGVYGQPDHERALRDAFEREGKKLDMGKSCVRFSTLEDLALQGIAQAIASTTPDEHIAAYEASRRR